jgi:hypothetical protein
MASIWNEIELTWDGETYTVRPSMEFINHLEQGNGHSLSALYMRLVNRDLPSGIACELIAKTLAWAGADVTAEQVFEATGGGMSPVMVQSASTILVGVMPKGKDSPSSAKKKPVTRRPSLKK